jgi:hypothetical protein
MLNQFCVSQNLRSMICERLPQELSDVKDAFLSTFDDTTYGNLLYDTSLFPTSPAYHATMQYQNTGTRTKLDDDLYLSLKSVYRLATQRGLLQNSITFQGLHLSTIQHSPCDSYVIHGEFPAGQWRASYITAIVVYLRKQTGDKEDRVLLMVDNYDTLSNTEAEADPFYRRWPDYPDVVGRLFKRTVSNSRMVVDIRDVVCHYAHTPITVPRVPGEYIHALPLDRVSSSNSRT